MPGYFYPYLEKAEKESSLSVFFTTFRQANYSEPNSSAYEKENEPSFNRGVDSRGFLLFACVEDGNSDKNPDGLPKDKLSLIQARRYFESVSVGLSRAGVDGTLDEHEKLTPGQIAPDWGAAVLGASDSLSGVVTPFAGDYDYYSYQYDEEIEEAALISMPRSLVVLKKSGSGEMGTYVRYLVPDWTYAEKVRTDETVGFSGLTIYTTLSGFPIGVGRWQDGVLQASFAFTTSSPTEAEWEEMRTMLESVYVVRQPIEPTSRRVQTAPNEIQIEEVVIIGVAPAKEVEDIDFKPLPIEDLKFEFLNSAGGGGASSVSILDRLNCAYKNNKSLHYADPQVEKLLDKIMEDCMGQFMIGLLCGNIEIRTGYFSPSSQMQPDNIVLDYYHIKMGSSISDSLLLEELFHVYQYKHGADWKTAKLNGEVEAKLACLLYEERAKCKSYSKNQLGGEVGVDAFNKMILLFKDNDTESDVFASAYQDAATALRTVGNYRNEDFYPYDPSKSDVDNISNLMIDCTH